MLSLMIVAYSQIVFSPIQLYSTVPSMCFQKHSKTSIVWGLWANGLKLTPWHPRVCFPLHRPEVAVKSEQWEKLNSHPLQQRRRLICFPPQFSSKQKKYKQRREKRRGIAGEEEREERKRHGDHFQLLPHIMLNAHNKGDAIGESQKRFVLCPAKQKKKKSSFKLVSSWFMTLTPRDHWNSATKNQKENHNFYAHSPQWKGETCKGRTYLFVKN